MITSLFKSINVGMPRCNISIIPSRITGIALSFISLIGIGFGLHVYRTRTLALQRKIIEQQLNDWCNEKIGDSEYEGRQKAMRIILAGPDHEGKMHLQNLGLTSLPANLEFLLGLTLLNISNNKITSLAGVTFPAGLRKLFIEENQITSLEGVTFPAGLEYLDISNNKITSLARVTFPAGFRFLHVNNNQISSLEGVTFPAGLRFLHVNNNQISSLEGVTFPAGLQFLSVNNNQISSVERVTFPARLESLDISNNQISSLVRFRFQGNRLRLAQNPLVAGSLQGLRIPSGVVEDVPEATLINLGAQIIARDLSRGRMVQQERPPLNILIRQFDSNYTPENYESLLEDQNAPYLADFLHRVNGIQEISKSAVYPLLELALINKRFRETFFEEVYSTSINCNDRPLHFFGRISALAAVYRAEEQKKPFEVLRTLISLHRIRIIEDYAEKVTSNPETGEAPEALEAALYLLLQLRKEFQLPIGITSMQNQRFAENLLLRSNLTLDDHLNALRRQITEKNPRTPQEYAEIVSDLPYWEKRCMELDAYQEITSNGQEGMNALPERQRDKTYLAAVAAIQEDLRRQYQELKKEKALFFVNEALEEQNATS